jgi:DNA mismatch repair protein MutL
LLREDVPLATAAPKDTMSYRPARPYEPPCAPLGTPHVPQRCVSTCPFREPVGQIQFAPDRDLEPNTEQLVLPDQPRYRLLGQLLNTYIVVEEDEGIVLIDQHAAHERILYELFADRFSGKSSTQLLFPLIITLPHDEAAIFVDQLAQFRSYGIDIEPFGSHAFTIRSVPVYLKDAPFESIIRTFIAWCTEEQGVAKADFAELLIEKLQALMACKAAIKAGDQLSNEQMHALISKLMRCHSRTICAHGRPTTHRLSKYEIEKIFQRCG